MTINYNARKANSTYSPRQGSAVNQGMATEKQTEWIKSLCGMKRVAVPSLEGISGETASAMIKKLQELPNWREASEAQIDKIMSRCKDMALDIPEMVNLSMSKASKWIEFLDNKWNTEFANRVTAKQIDMMKKMMMCPDVDNSELYAIPEEMWAQLDEAEMSLQIALSSQIDDHINSADVEVKGIKSLIDQHAANFKLESITKSIASDFIAKNRAMYYKWAATRLSDGQKDIINKLIERTGGEPLSEETLMQFSRDHADEYIQQLQKEMGDTSLRGFGDEPQFLEVPDAWVKKREATMKRDVQTADWNNCIHGLYAIVGLQAEEEVVQATFQEKALDEVIDMLIDAGEDKQTFLPSLIHIMTEEDAMEYLNEWGKKEEQVPDSQDVPW